MCSKNEPLGFQSNNNSQKKDLANYGFQAASKSIDPIRLGSREKESTTENPSILEFEKKTTALMEDGEQAKKEEAEEKEESGPTSNSLSYE